MLQAIDMSKIAYTVQRNGQVTLPPQLRAEYGLKMGDRVKFVRGADGWMIIKQSPDPLELLDQLGEALKEKGITLEELTADGRGIRGDLLRELYDLTADSADD